MINKKIDLQAIIKDQRVRQELSKESLQWFFNIYFNHYVKYETPYFHKEIFNLAENEDIKNLLIVAFRGSAKSTIINMAYAIWSILGRHSKKFIVIVAQTKEQARAQMKNLKDEFDNNALLRADLGPFEESDDEWRSLSLTIPKYGVRIIAVCVGQSLRGIRHNQHRPDLIICDDIEDLESVKTQESRDKTFRWITSELIPAGDKNTRLVMIGNLLHKDSTIMRMRDKIMDNELSGEYREYPLTDKEGKCSWKGKYPTEQDIAEAKAKVTNETVWRREYLLEIVAEQDVVIRPEWIQFYNELPPTSEGANFRSRAIGLDLAISLKEHADYTAIVSVQINGWENDFKIYVMQNCINSRLTHLQTINSVVKLAHSLAVNTELPRVFVEDVAYQYAVVEQLEAEGLDAVGVKVGTDKRTRLALISSMIQDGTILFPRQGCEKLIQQLVGFGAEKHDDLADAFSLLIGAIAIEKNKAEFSVMFFDEI